MKNHNPRRYAMVTAVGLVAALALAGCGSTNGSTNGSASGSGALVLASWGGVSDQGSQIFSDAFTKKDGTKVSFVPAPGQQVAGIEAQATAGKIQWDLADGLNPDGAAVLAKKGLLQKLPADVKGRLEKLQPGFVSDYGITYATYSNVIVCNAKAVAKCPTTPAEFFDTKNFPGRRTLSGIDPLVAMSFALAADGVPYNQIFPMDVDRAMRKLNTLKSSLATLYQSGDQSIQLITSGEADMGILYNGRAAAIIQQHNPAVDLQVSWDGAFYSPTESVVFKGAPDKEAAYKYLEFIASSTDLQAKYADTTTYGFPNTKYVSLVKPAIAKFLPENPAHFDQRIVPDYSWFIDNETKVNAAWKTYTSQ